MIARLRRVHRRIHLLLWPAVALLFGAALAKRPAVDVRDDWLAALAGAARESEGAGRRIAGQFMLFGSSIDAFGPWPARLSLWTDGTVELTPLRPLDQPELLVYWLPDPFVGDVLPDSAQLLGRLAGTQAQRFHLPSRASVSKSDPGSLVVYSLGHQAVVASARLASIGVWTDPPTAPEGGA